MDKKRIQELSKEIFELSYGAIQLDREELKIQMDCIFELATELQELIGNSTTIELIGYKPTTASAVAYFKLEVRDDS